MRAGTFIIESLGPNPQPPTVHWEEPQSLSYSSMILKGWGFKWGFIGHQALLSPVSEPYPPNLPESCFAIVSRLSDGARRELSQRA